MDGGCAVGCSPKMPFVVARIQSKEFDAAVMTFAY